MEQSLKQPCCCNVRLCGKEKNELCRYSYDENVPYES